MGGRETDQRSAQEKPIMATGVRYNSAGIKALFAAKKKRITAASFRPQVRAFASSVLSKCVTTTPARSQSLITKAQRKQYNARINYIPSIHHQSDPMLIVNDQAEHWLKFNGVWLNASKWKLSPAAWAAYQMLNAERERRMETSRGEFIAHRVQARFLYRRSWTQVASSLGISIAVSGVVIASKTRRQPPQNPPRAYGQWHGGKTVLSASVTNDFLNVETAYWPGDGKRIIDAALVSCRPAFEREIAREIERRLGV